MSTHHTYPEFLFSPPRKEEAILLNPDSVIPKGSEWFPECKSILEFAQKAANFTNGPTGDQESPQSATISASNNPRQTSDLNPVRPPNEIRHMADNNDVRLNPSSTESTETPLVNDSLELQFAQKIYQALVVIRVAMRQYRRLAFSFNGGKDNTVVLYLIRAACLQAVIEENSDFESITPHELLRSRFIFFYVHNEVQIKQVMKFMCLIDHEQNLGTVVYLGTSFKNCIVNFYNDYHSDVVFMGVRSTDPNGKTTIFSHCSPSWPQFMRVCPILYWSYVDVWDFLKRFRIHYCTLYDQGYTSLGSATHTIKHPTLRDGAIMHRRIASMVHEPQFSAIGGSTQTGKQTLQQITHIFTSRVSLSTYGSNQESHTARDKNNQHNKNDIPVSNGRRTPIMPQVEWPTDQAPSAVKERENEHPCSKTLLLTDYLSRGTMSVPSVKGTDGSTETPASTKLRAMTSTSVASLVSTTDEEIEQGYPSMVTPSLVVDSSNSSMISQANILHDRNMHQILAGRETHRHHRLLSNTDAALSASEEYSEAGSITSYMGDAGNEYYGSVTPQDVCAYSGPRLVIDELVARGVPTELLPPQFDPSEEDGEIEDDLCSASAIFLPVSEGEDERINRV
ncbi:FAD synthetase [Giardia duodenalis]|uniref:FAD synthase n=1 Tax=Giardia intestinalis TaxID=5741 RepID=V6TIQ8_GIAIN|nr:FAD synthetase [Giardia intestinalis]